MTTKIPGVYAPDGSLYITPTDGSGNLVSILPTGLLYSKVTVDFNAGNTDTQMTISLPSGFTRWRAAGVQGGALTISGASASISTATFGLFTASGGGGTAIITAGATITVTSSAESTNNNLQSTVTNNSATESFNSTTLFFRVGTPQGSAATAVVTLFYLPVS